MKNSTTSTLHFATDLDKDVSLVQRIPIIDTILQVVCEITGMGFAVVARVTNDRWIACAVRDQIAFGLTPGGELPVETTICSEIRDSREPVVIDHVAESSDFKDHQTPRIYGFQSYIAVPIFLKGGAFFGTLCAIDPAPALLNNPRIIGLFRLFAELIAFHLEGLVQLERSSQALQELNRTLQHSQDEVTQYQYISHHNLQEPLRKMRLFVSKLREAAVQQDPVRFNETLEKVTQASERFASLISEVDHFNSFNSDGEEWITVDLNEVLADVISKLRLSITDKQAQIVCDVLPSIKALPLQVKHLFYQLLSNALKYSRSQVAPQITIKATLLSGADRAAFSFTRPDRQYVEIILEDNGVGIKEAYREKAFTIFSSLDGNGTLQTSGMGLAQCRKIVRNHKGEISLIPTGKGGTAFLILLPLEQ